MAKYQITGPDGTTYEVTAPDTASEAEVLAYAQKNYKPAEKPSEVVQQAKNAVGGLVRGAGSIGATILDSLRGLGGAAVEAAPEGMRPQVTAGAKDLPRGAEMRAGMDAGLKQLGGDPDSLAFQGGKLGAEIAGTLGVGGAVANTMRGAPAALLEAIKTGGFRAGATTGATNALTRAAGGAINGGATVGLVDPEHAGAGAVIGAATPGVLQLTGAAGQRVRSALQGGSERLMQSAIKPTIAQLRTGEADVAVKTLLERGINPNEAGVNKLRALIDDIDNQITAQISASPAVIDKQNVLARLAGTRQQFTNQVSPTGDLNAIQAVSDDFVAHPGFPGQAIPVQAAQDLKRGTYKVLAKKYGQMGGAETEAQKALARGLKEEIATAVPAVQGLNAEQAKLLTTLEVAERRALMELNKNPMGLAALAQSPSSWAMFMADKSALFKSLAARMLTASAGGVKGAAPALPSPTTNLLLQAGTRAAPVAATQD